jgi:tetratricopeptide (TPR) repeat protein
MDGTEAVQNTANAGVLVHEGVQQTQYNRDLVMKFESLGGSGHGPEFAIFQRHFGGKPDGLLAQADLSVDAVVAALESRFEGVGAEENTIVFVPGESEEWWTKDTRHWMAMRSFVRTDRFNIEQATPEVCGRLRAGCRQLMADLAAGEKIFVFRNLHRNITEDEIHRLHAAIRSYGDSTLFIVRYGDDLHPNGTVETVKPGVLIGYIDHFAFSPDNRSLGSADSDWLVLCERAIRLHASRSITVAACTNAPPVEQVGQDTIKGRPTPAAERVVNPCGPERQVDTPAVRRLARPNPARKIVLIGNCQMQAMMGLYRRFVAGRTGDVLQHVPSYQDLSDEGRDLIQQADVVVEQLFDIKPQVDTDALSTTTPRIFIPMVTGAFLWPFAGSPHPKNTGFPFLIGGPYGGEASDSYLNRLILSGTDPEEAVETYVNLDVNSRVNLDRLFEIVMDRQRSRDAAADYNIADVMQQHFRTEQIFLSPYHPNVRIATTLASQFFKQLGAVPDEIDRMIDFTRITPFPKSELPFHPHVCRHFGLEFVSPDRRYRYLNEGLFTFREYALRYMRYEWNSVLEEGMHFTHIGKMEEARDRLLEAVEYSPLSAAAYSTLGYVHGRLGALDDALEASRRAVELEPDAAAYRASRGNFLRENGQLDEAVAAVRSAVDLDPVEPHYRVLLAHMLRQAGDIDEACASVRVAIHLDPYSAKLQGDLAAFLEAKGELEEAVAVLRVGVKMDPEDENMRSRLAQMLARLNRFDEAIEVAREAVAYAPDSLQARTTLSDLLLRGGDPADALNEAYTAAVVEPENAHAYWNLGNVLRQTGDFSAAEAAFRRAAKIDPRNAHFQHELSVVLLHQERIGEAIRAATEATKLETGNPHRFVHLAALIAGNGDLAGAQAAQRGAVELEPMAVAFRVGLSDLLARAGRLDEALEEASIVVGYHPKSMQALGQLAHIAELRGEFERANEVLLRALEVEPRNDYLLRRLGTLQARWKVAAGV